jgi:hypothetical protein
MDRFIQSQETGKVVDTQNEFTLDRAHSKQKLMDSIPKSSVSTVLRMLDSAAWQLGNRPAVAVHESRGKDNHSFRLAVNLSKLPQSEVEAYIDELRRPFGAPSGVSTLARATYRATRAFEHVDVHLGTSELGESVGDLRFTKGDISIPEGLKVKYGGLRLFMRGLSAPDFETHRASIARRVFRLMDSYERLLPLESHAKKTSGFFDYRTRPFTAIRSYAALPEGESGPGMLLDLWDGPYDPEGTSTTLLRKKEPGKFLFLRWKPNYGNPTFIHHFLDSQLQFDKHILRATFWIETVDRPAHIHFFSEGIVSDPEPVPGPRGLTGMVLWPGLKYDIWSSRLVLDKAYHEAIEWALPCVAETADTLAENLDTVIERLGCSTLIKKSYVEETIAKIRSYWG